MKKWIKRISLAVISLAAAVILTVAGINIYIKHAVSDMILTEEEAANLESDCIIVLGAGVHPDKTPSNMLEDRLLRGIALYDSNAAGKLLMSGDHGEKYYNEVDVMKTFATDRGVPSEDVFMDHAGFSTYETMYRAKAVFDAENVVVVTQGYHLYRALYDAKKLGLRAYGVASDQRSYMGQIRRDVREVLARTKDFLFCIVKPEPTYLGEVIPVSGDGNATNGDDTGEDG